MIISIVAFNGGATYPEPADANGNRPSFSFPMMNSSNPVCLNSPQSGFFISSKTTSPRLANRFVGTIAGPKSNDFGVSVRQVGPISGSFAASFDVVKYLYDASCVFQGFGETQFLLSPLKLE
jgi:hypothetical protein